MKVEVGQSTAGQRAGMARIAGRSDNCGTMGLRWVVSPHSVPDGYDGSTREPVPWLSWGLGGTSAALLRRGVTCVVFVPGT